MSDFFPIYIYFGLTALVTVATVGLSALFPAQVSSSTSEGKQDSGAKYLPYESGMRTETHLLQKRFSLKHYLVALIFLVFDIEVIFLYPWAVVAKDIGPFAFYEMAFFWVALLIGFAYVWNKRGLQWE